MSCALPSSHTSLNLHKPVSYKVVQRHITAGLQEEEQRKEREEDAREHERLKAEQERLKQQFLEEKEAEKIKRATEAGVRFRSCPHHKLLQWTWLVWSYKSIIHSSIHSFMLHSALTMPAVQGQKLVY